MKVFFILSDEHIYLPKVYERIINGLKPSDIAGMALLPITLPGKSTLAFLKKYVLFFGPLYFSYVSGKSAWFKCLDTLRRVLPLRRPCSLRAVAERAGIPVFDVERVNSPEFLKKLSDIKPDLVVSQGSAQIFKKDLLSIPTIGVINIHLGALPRYRGVFPVFWAMLHNEREIGATVHMMDVGIDSGGILSQKMIPVEARDSFTAVMNKAMSAVPDMVLDVIRSFQANRATPLQNDASQGSYFSFPQRADAKKFRRMGKRFF